MRWCSQVTIDATIYVMNQTINAIRISATIPAHLANFLEQYQKNHGLENRSQALSQAITALQELEMIRGYAEIAQAQATGQLTYEDFENGDGLEDTKWKS